MVYIVGKLVVSTSDSLKQANKRILLMYGSLASGWFIATAMDMYNDFKLAPVDGFQTEVWPSFWIPAAEENRTTYEFGFILTSAACGYGIYLFKKHKLASIIIIAANVIVQYFAIHVEGRENSLLLMLSIVTVAFLYLVDHWSRIDARVKKAVRYFLVLILLFIVLFIIAFNLNWFGINDIFYSSYWSGSGGLFTNVRFQYDLEGIRSILKYPLDDWRGKEDTFRGHATMIEYGRVYGLTVYVLIWTFIICTYKDCIKLFLLKNEHSWIKYLVIPGVMSAYLYYAMEPNGLVYKSFWMVGLYLNGMIRGWLEKNKEPVQKLNTSISSFSVL